MLAYGANGSGKTNLLEGLHVAAQGLSPRTRADANLARAGGDHYVARIEADTDDGHVEQEVRWQREDGKSARVNGAPAPSLEALRHASAALVFTPDRLAVVKAGPSVRRAYFDRAAGRLHPARAQTANEYADALGQRNAALRRAAAAAPLESVEPWSERVATLGLALAELRQETIAELRPPFAAAGEALGLPACDLVYEPNDVTREILTARLARDLDRGTTGAGPHLDEIRLRSAGRDLRTHGSQGEQRVGVLALLLAEAHLLTERRSVPPLLLLDDVLSELDGARRSALAQRLRTGGQVLVTSAARGALPVDADQALEVELGHARVVA